MNTPNILVSGKQLFAGGKAPIQVLCSDSAGALADPDGLTVQVQPFGQAVVTYYWHVVGQADSPEITRTGVGDFLCQHPITSDEKHQVKAVATGSVEAVMEGSFPVMENNIV